MSTAACGINCDVCRLNLLGTCSTCGSGRSHDGLKKMAAQERILGQPCPILACAIENRIEYCPRDCDRFPCIEFRSGPYPFSQGFLDMQDRRRAEKPPAKTPSGNIVEVPTEYWGDLEQRDMKKLCKNAQAIDRPPTGVLLPFLSEYLLVDIRNHCLFHQGVGELERIDNSLLELLCLVYLLNVGPLPLADKMVSVKEFRSAHFFSGPHELKVEPVLARYGNDHEAFKRTAESVGGEALELADAAYKFPVFPKVPFYYLLWKGDEEFPPSLSILFDRSVEDHLAADAIWGLVNLVSDILIVGDIRALFREG